MTIEIFLSLLFSFSVITSITTELIKQKITGKSSLIAFMVAIVVGIVGTLIYYQLNALGFSVNNIIYSGLMGLATGLTSQVGYDKIKEAINNFIT